MSKHWIKLHTEMLDDIKVGKFKDWLFRRFILFLLVAGEYGKDGQLPPVDELAWRLRLREEQVEEALGAMLEVGVAHQEANAWWITNYAKYQSPDSGAERVSRYREKRVTNVTNDSYSDSDSSSCSDLKLTGSIFKAYENEIGLLTPMVSEALNDALTEFPEDWFIPAFEEAVKHNARNWKYVEAILKGWKVNGFQAKRNGAGSGQTLTAEEERQARQAKLLASLKKYGVES